MRGPKEALTEDERYALAEHVVAHLKEHGDPWAEGRTRGRAWTSGCRLHDQVTNCTSAHLGSQLTARFGREEAMRCYTGLAALAHDAKSA